jgi:chemotaxis signal transduction protein
MEAALEQLFNTSDSAPVEISPLAVPADVAAAEPRPQVSARLIEYAHGRSIALPPHTTYALIENPSITVVPGAANHALGLLIWQEMRLPVLNLHALLHPGTNTAAASAPRYALVVAYQRAARAPLAYGAFALDQLPQTIAVSDDEQCELPDDSKMWAQLALSCFRHNGVAVPILDTARLFSTRPDPKRVFNQTSAE